MLVLANVTTADTYLARTTLEGPGIERLTFTIVSGGAIRYQLASGGPPGEWGPESLLGPGGASLDRACTGVRVRSAAAGQPVQVTVEAVQGADLPRG